MRDSEQEFGRIRLVLVGAYPIAAILILGPVLDTLVRTWPIRMGEVAWRFGAAGMWLNVLVTPLLGAFMIVVAAGGLGHRRLVRASACVLWVVTGTLLIAEVAFALDYLQLRGAVGPEALAGFDVAAVKAMIAGVLGAVAGGVLASVSWRTSHKARAGKSKVDHRETGLKSRNVLVP